MKVLSRRHFLTGVLFAPLVFALNTSKWIVLKPHSNDRDDFVIVDGWILKASDLEAVPELANASEGSGKSYVS